MGAYNVLGPFPRGQCVQYGRCTDGVVEDFICKNQWEYSWPEDSISMWRSANSTVRSGAVLGNNANTGVGVMFEQSAVLENSWGLVSNVQVLQVGSCFSTYGGTRVNFDSVTCRANHNWAVGGRACCASGLGMY